MGLVKHIKKVSFELSNLCPYAPFHKACPAHLVKDPQVLPMKAIFQVVNFLAKKNYHGWISPFIYSEPMADPRLFKILEHMKEKMPNCMIRILSCGYGVTQDLLDELAVIGITLFKIDAYSKKDLERFMELKSERIQRIKITKGTLDDRLKIYDLPKKNLNWPCFAPLADINIRADGTVNLCCLDYENRYTFGNIHQDPFPKILGTMVETFQRLSHGQRFLDICSRCNRQILGYKCRRKHKSFEYEDEF